MKQKHIIYFDEFPKVFLNEEDSEEEEKKEDATKEHEIDDDPSDINYNPASASLKNVFSIVNKLLNKQKSYRKELINSDKTDITNRDLLIKRLESVTREIDFFDSEFQRLLNSEESQYKDKL